MLSGLRGRFVAAMLLVSAVTLTLTGVALVSPLQNRLRNDEIDGLTRAVRAEQPAFARLTARDLLTSNSSQLRALARTLHRATGADISVFTESGRRVFATDRDPGVTSPEAAAALRTGRVSRTRTGPRGEARVGVPLLVDGERIAVELRKPLPNLAGAVRVVRNAFLLAAAISLLVALLIGVLLARQLVGRLRALRDTALRVAEIGPVAEMQSDMTRDEVGDLTRAFVTMQQHLREQEQARRTFVATASHELRTPLTSLRMMLDLLRDDLASDTPDLVDARSQAARADAQASRLAELATKLLDLSRIDAGLPLRAELIEIGEVARAVAAEFAVRLAERDGELELDAPGPCWAVADPGSVAQIVRILIDNGFNHAPAGKRLTVATMYRDGRAVVSVTDDGPGVAADDAERIFGRFERGQAGSESPGFGLGLAIARELARRMSGDVVVAPRTTLAGACFSLALPAAPAAP